MSPCVCQIHYVLAIPRHWSVCGFYTLAIDYVLLERWYSGRTVALRRLCVLAQFTSGATFA